MKCSLNLLQTGKGQNPSHRSPAPTKKIHLESNHLVVGEAEPALLKQTLPCLCAHELYHHLQRLRPQVHARRVRKVLVDVLEGAGSPEHKMFRPNEFHKEIALDKLYIICTWNQAIFLNVACSQV